MELDREVMTGIDISAGATVLTHTLAGAALKAVIARVTIGSSTNPLSGVGGVYQLELRINDIVALPRATITAQSSDPAILLVSSIIPLEAGDVATVIAQGLSGDVVVDTLAILSDMTPFTNADIVGDGDVVVDHDYGGTDALRIVDGNGAGIDNAKIRVYETADYADGLRGANYVRAKSSTDDTGRWSTPVMLDPGTYTLVVYKQGSFRAMIVPITVS